MKKYVSIVLLVSFVNLPWVHADTTVQNDKTGGEVACAEHKGTDRTDQLNSLRRLSYCRTGLNLQMSGFWLHVESEEDTARAIIEEEQTHKSCLSPPVVLLFIAIGVVVGVIVIKNAIESLPDEW